MRFRYEILMWFNAIVKSIPGNIGCWLRIKLLPVKAGVNVKIWDHVHIDSPSKLCIGNNVSINRGSIINAGGGVHIGDDVLIGPNVIIYSQNHKFYDSNIPINKQGYELKEVVIGNNVWIAAGVAILPGITIGNNVVVGAGSVVSKNIEGNSVVVGNPMKNIKII